jgi:hypothetical protein
MMPSHSCETSNISLQKTKAIKNSVEMTKSLKDFKTKYEEKCKTTLKQISSALSFSPISSALFSALS